jgi:hypothetical protein
VCRAALDFAPSRASGSRAAATKANTKIQAVEVSDSSDEDFGRQESSGEEAVPKKKAKR